MKPELERLRVGSLTNLEAGQLINRHLDDLGTVSPTLQTDGPYTTYVHRLTAQLAIYDLAVAQVQKNELTEKLAKADFLRDRAVRAFGTALRLYSYSDIASEQEAARGLNIIYQSQKRIADLNYEAETKAIDKLLSELAKPAAAAKVTALGIGRWVNFMQSSNQAFAVLFGTRIQGEASTETYDMKAVRRETFEVYANFCDYLVSMVKATNGELFVTALNLVNAGRKYYADLIARRGGNDDNDEEEPGT